MRYSALASAILLAATTAPALARPVTIRSTEDASLFQREFQDELVERGYYYDDLVARSRGSPLPRPLRQTRRRDPQSRNRSLCLCRRRCGRGTGIGAGATMSGPPESTTWTASCSSAATTTTLSLGAVGVPSAPSASAKHAGGIPEAETEPSAEAEEMRAGNWHRGRSDYEWSAREYDLDGELFERGYYDDLVARSRGSPLRPLRLRQTRRRDPRSRNRTLCRSRRRCGRGTGIGAGATMSGPPERTTWTASCSSAAWR
ncbi:uncharacterized protein B0H18DRAFT_496506 [Fomitopsis serialis]|uniref:uncharacterized protein n=1 Tax=Fomitopsis serialis TaxID=139415 RepID=UPI00200745D6|nr:uncharacterized protein B0H18DRAFT_496506 [Neoantrodia serialis]KAH9935037.1 hypothetical protein B0H18DRAFT_496506 [Neoantrodia serialis]